MRQYGYRRDRSPKYTPKKDVPTPAPAIQEDAITVIQVEGPAVELPEEIPVKVVPPPILKEEAVEKAPEPAPETAAGPDPAIQPEEKAEPETPQDDDGFELGDGEMGPI